MNFDERLEAVKARREELRARHDEMVKIMRESVDAGDQKFAEDVRNLKRAFGDASLEINEQADALGEKIDNKVDERIEKVENRRQNIKDKIEGIKTDIQKADQESLIEDILSYAEDCAIIAAYYSEEAAYAMVAAEEQIKLYNEKFGE